MTIEELTKLKRRWGKHISLSRPLKLDDNIKQKLENAESYIRKLTRKGTRHRSLSKSLERQKEIIDIIQEAETADYPLAYMDLFGILALRYGIEKQAIFPYAKALSAMSRRGFVSTEGTPLIRRALQNDLVKIVLDIIETSSDHLTYKTILKGIGTPKEEIMIKEINVSLNLLDTINKVLKLPVDSREKGAPVVWMNPDYKETSKSIPYWNIKYILLLSLSERESATKNDFASDKLVSEVVSVRTCLGNYKYPRIVQALDDLLHFGLIKYKKENIKGRGTIVYYILPQAKELINLTESQGYLNEDLRRALLGERYIGLKPSEEMTLQKIKRIGNIFGNRKEGEGPYALASRIEENESYTANIIRELRDPLRDIKRDTFFTKYFGHLDPIEQKGILIYLAQRENNKIKSR